MSIFLKFYWEFSLILIYTFKEHSLCRAYILFCIVIIILVCYAIKLTIILCFIKLWRFIIACFRKENRVSLHTEVASNFSCEGEEKPRPRMYAFRSTANGCLEQKWRNNWGSLIYLDVILLLESSISLLTYAEAFVTAALAMVQFICCV